MNTAEGLGLVARVVGGLIIVLVLVAISARIAKRSRHFGGNSDLEIVDRLGISKEAQLAVVRVGGRHLLIGISPQGVTMLSHLDDATMAFEDGAPLTALEESSEPDARDDVPASGSPPPVAATVPPVNSAPVTTSGLPENIAAELIARFEAEQPAGFEPAQFHRVEAQEPEPRQPEPQLAEPLEARYAEVQKLEVQKLEAQYTTAQLAALELAEAQLAAAHRIQAQQARAQQDLQDLAHQVRAATGAEPGDPPRRRRNRHAAPMAEVELGAALTTPVPNQAAAPTVEVVQAAQAAQAVPEIPEIPEVQLPGAVNLGDYPDLASALRAAGRTTRPGTVEDAQQSGSSSWIPSQRAANDVPDLSHATSSAPVAPDPAEVPADGPAERRRGGRTRRAVPQQRPEQAGGSVLSPATWRQGIEALREMTVRRG